MSLPLLLSLPHAGLRIPEEVGDACVLTPEQIVEDGDESAAEIYDLTTDVEAFVSTDVARAIVDLNRAEDDRTKDGVIKTHTCWDVPVYSTPPDERLVQQLLTTHYRPYHARLTQLSQRGVVLAVDCHTMAAVGPPVAPDPGEERPWVCLSNADGTCPQLWMNGLRACFEDRFGPSVRVNTPFRGGYITRTHAAEMPWIQLELSRGSFMSAAQKRRRVLAALQAWVGSVPTDRRPDRTVSSG